MIRRVVPRMAPGIAAVVVAYGCAGETSGTDGESHFLCAHDADCAPNFRCQSGVCGALGSSDAGDVDSGSLLTTDSGDAGPSIIACPTSSSPEPLDDGCTEAVCYAVIRLNYLSLALEGYSIISAPQNAVDTNGAKALAEQVFATYNEYWYPGDSVYLSGPNAGVFRAFQPPGDFGGFALIGAESGAVLIAGSVMWLGRGDYWLPPAWKPASDLYCIDAPASAAEVFTDMGTTESGGCNNYGRSEPLGPGPEQAMERALRTNLAAQFALRGSFSAYVIPYIPADGGSCWAKDIDYVVVLSQVVGG